MTTLRQLIQSATKRLKQAGIEGARLDAQLLACHALKFDRAQLLTNSEKELTATECEAIEALIRRRVQREPVYRIIGIRDFWGLPFGLNEATLEPRPDSEVLIETALKRVMAPPQHILDLGTGTGCLLLALLSEWKEATGLGIDKAPKAVQQAQKNAKHLGLDKRATFQVGSWLDDVDGTFDVIICNPPYIPQKDMKELEPEVLKHDPTAALIGGEDGLDPYRYLCPRLPDYLNPNGFVLFEVGIGQAQDVAAMMKNAGFKEITITKDLGGVERCVSGAI